MQFYDNLSTMYKYLEKCILQHYIQMFLLLLKLSVIKVSLWADFLCFLTIIGITGIAGSSVLIDGDKTFGRIISIVLKYMTGLMTL